MDERITIIEGPPPVFESVDDGWALGLNEGPYLYDLALTRLRTFNGPALVERCHRAWNNQQPIYLHYRNDMGLEETTPIMAARTIETDEGHVLLLWCRIEHAESLPESEDFGEDDEDFDDADLL
jgi:hypothetical protein